MPYVITSRRDEHIEGLGIECTHLQRRAVATLEEDELARVLFDGRTDTFNAAYIIGQISRLPESGGSVGPLPDGTVIEVEWANWDTLKPDWNASDTEQSCCDAFNTRETVA